MKRNYLIIVFFLLFLFCGASWAQLAEIGINPFLTERGARPLGMGGAFAGLGDDAYSLFYNPGGMAWARGITLSFQDMENVTAAQAYPTGYGSSFGLAVVTTKISDISITGGMANFNSNLVYLSYGTKLNFLPALYKNEAFQRIGIGANIKGLFGQTLRRTGQRDISASGWNMDLGMLWKAKDWWSAGFSVQNIGGGEIKWNFTTAEAVSATARIAASAKIIGDIGISPIFVEGRELTVCGEMDISGSSPMLFRLGGEWGINKTYFLRAGVTQKGLNFGAGFRNDVWGVDVVSYREPVRNENLISFSVIYFPKEWIVVKKLDVEKPSVVLEKAIEKISLEDNFVTYNDKIEVSGKVKAGVEVYVNGLPAYTTENNNFKVVVPLEMEKNLVLVEARYESEKKIWKYKVLRKAKVQIAEEKKIGQELEKAVAPQEKEALRQKEQEVTQQRKKVEELVTMGVVEVSSEADFKLEANITRGELATWVAKATGLTLPKVEQDVFLDVRRDHPLASFIKAVSDWQMLLPFSDGTFRPDSPVSREEGERFFKILGMEK